MNKKIISLANQLIEELEKGGRDLTSPKDPSVKHLDIWVFDGKRVHVENVVRGWIFTGKLGGGQAE